MDLATVAHGQAVGDELLAAQAILDPELTHRAAGQVDPVEPACGTDPGHALQVQHQPIGRDVRKATELVDALDIVQAAIAQQVQAQRAPVPQPEHTIDAEAHHIHRRLR